MPSSATITTFYSFSPQELIRSAYINNNFSAFRGHFLPIHPNTATAATSATYDLGASDHRWGTVYCTSLNATNGVGGGGGSGLTWEESANSPQKTIENGMAVYVFEASLAQELFTELHVPSTYVAGNPIVLKIKAYIVSVSGTMLLTAQSTLVRAEVDDVSSTTNQRTTTNTAITMSAANDQEIQKINLDVTASDGTVNSVAVAAGDTLAIRLYRNTTDTATDDVKFLYKQCEVTLT